MQEKKDGRRQWLLVIGLSGLLVIIIAAISSVFPISIIP